MPRPVAKPSWQGSRLNPYPLRKSAQATDSKDASSKVGNTGRRFGSSSNTIITSKKKKRRSSVAKQTPVKPRFSSTLSATPRKTIKRGGPSVASPSRGIKVNRRRSGAVTALVRRNVGASVAAGVKPHSICAIESSGGAASNIRVAVRVRPENEMETNHPNSRTVIDILDDRMLVFDPKDNEDEFFYKGRLQNHRDLNKRVKRDHKFAFDVVFGPESSNEDVFNSTTKDLVDVLLSGFNCSVFVYGATGAGKTHTMLGNQENPGLTYRTVLELYQRLDSLADDVSCELQVSYLEIYNETVIDLISRGRALDIRDDGNSGVKVPGLSFHKPSGPEDLLRLLQSGNANRTQHPTDANAESSRSHAVFQVYLKQKSRSADLSTDFKIAKLSMIDLAGSERGTVAMSMGATRLREGANINKSLLALGNCINALADGSKYVPFRNSKLTRLLKDSIGGNCRTVMISNVTPSSLQFEDTYNTLKYADRAKRIKIELRKNVVTVDAQAAQYAKALETLRQELETVKTRNTDLQKENNELKEKIQVFQSQSATEDEDRKEKEATIEDLRRHIVESQAKDEEIERLKSTIRNLENQSSSKAASEPLLPVNETAKEPILDMEEDTKLVEEHKKLLSKFFSRSGKAKKLRLKKEFADRILTRSKLISLKHHTSQKIEKFSSRLDKKSEKAEQGEQEILQALESSQGKLNEAIFNRNDVSARMFKQDIELLEREEQVNHLIAMLGLYSEEQTRTEDILTATLPMVKEKHLLLSHFNQLTEESLRKFSDLVNMVQCTKIQFNENAKVQVFSASPCITQDESLQMSVRIAKAGMDTLRHLLILKPRRLQYEDTTEEEDDDDGEEQVEEDLLQQMPSPQISPNSTFTIGTSDVECGKGICPDPSSPVSPTSPVVNSTFTVEDEFEKSPSPRNVKRKATPFKRLVADKENDMDDTLSKLDSPLQTRLPLKDSNSLAQSPSNLN